MGLPPQTPPDETGYESNLGGYGGPSPGLAPHREQARVQESGREASPTNALTRAVRALARTCPAFIAEGRSSVSENVPGVHRGGPFER